MSQFFQGVTAGSLPPAVPLSFLLDDGNSAVATAYVIQVLGGSGTFTSLGVSNQIKVNVTEVAPNYVNVTSSMSPYVVTATDYYISCDTSTGLITILLPNAPTQYDQFIIKDRTGNAITDNVTVTTVGGVVTIDGMTTYIFDEEYESIEMIFNGTSYEIF